MKSTNKSKKLYIGGMTCANCQNKIEKKLRNTAGIQNAAVSYSTGIAAITYDTDIISLQDISAVVKRLGYEVLKGDDPQTPAANRIVGLLVIIISLYVLLQRFGILNLLVPSQLADTNMGYGMLFVIGLLTSVHCVAMCGGINLSQCLPKKEESKNGNGFSTLRPALLYNIGRVISYTTVGFVVGMLGSVITFSNTLQGILKLIAGIFMIIMGINMLNLFPWLRRFQPRMPRAFALKVDKAKSKASADDGSIGPLIVGLLNGLMPCGPLQSMQIYALSTGNPIAGALSMMLFSLGTVPLMFGLSALSSALGKRFTKKVMTIGAVLVVVLGLSILSQGWNLSGSSLSSANMPSSPDTVADTASDIVGEDAVQVINSTLASRKYPEITIQVGIPVKWIIDAPEGSINGCNNRFFISDYNIEHTFKTGENIIEFIPTETGTFRYSCWMGMISSTITVVEAGVGNSISVEESGADAALNPIPANYAIPTDKIAVAEIIMDIDDGSEYQKVAVELTDDGFSPAVIIVQVGMDVEWLIDNKSTRRENFTLLVPAYYTELNLDSDENLLLLYPTESFDFSNRDNTFYGYVKVVDNLDNIDIKAIKEEAAGFETMIYPADTLQSGGTGTCCH